MNEEEIWGRFPAINSTHVGWGASTRTKTSRFFARKSSGDSLSSPKLPDDLGFDVGAPQEYQTMVSTLSPPKVNVKGAEREENGWAGPFRAGTEEQFKVLNLLETQFKDSGDEQQKTATWAQASSLWNAPSNSKLETAKLFQDFSIPEREEDEGHQKKLENSKGIQPQNSSKASPKTKVEETTPFTVPAKNIFLERSSAAPFTPQKARMASPPPEEQLEKLSLNSVPAVENVKLQIACKFFLDGFCANGDNCRYLHNIEEAQEEADEAEYDSEYEYQGNIGLNHDESVVQMDPAVGTGLVQPLLPSGVSSWDPSGELCTFHVSNDCRYGGNCRYLHGNQCSCCLLNVLHPLNAERSQEHIQACATMYSATAAVHTPAITTTEAQDEIACGICMNQTRSLGRKFGLLVNCDHAFCLECLREYRGNDFSGRAIRSCPICFTESDLVLPSFVFVVEPEKRKELFGKHVKRLASIPCKHFNYGEGACPFGTGCYYAHIDKRAAMKTSRLKNQQT